MNIRGSSFRASPKRGDVSHRQMVNTDQDCGRDDPGKGGQASTAFRLQHRRRRREGHGANASIIFVPPHFLRMPSWRRRRPVEDDRLHDRGHPTMDMIQVKHYLKGRDVLW